MEPTDPVVTVKIPVPQRYKDYIVKRQSRRHWYVLAGGLGGVNAVFYFLWNAFRWKWQFQLPGDAVLLLLGLPAYAKEVRKPWQYALDERGIRLFVTAAGSQLAELKELEWAKTQVVGVEHDEWQGLPLLKLKVLPDLGCLYVLVYSPAEEEDVATTVLPLIEKYRRTYRQKIWADQLRS